MSPSTEMELRSHDQPRRRASRLLLIAPSAMNYISGGTVLFRALLATLPRGSVAVAAVGGSSAELPTWLHDVPHKGAHSLLYHRSVAAALRRLRLEGVWAYPAYVLRPRQVAPRIARFARDIGADKLWVHASGPAIATAVLVQQLTGLPLHVSVQDDIDGHLTTSEADVLRPWVSRLFEVARSIDVTSDGMMEYYRARYRLEEKLHLFQSGGVAGLEVARPRTRAVLKRIAYAGNVWDVGPLVCLANALRSLNGARRPEDALRLQVYSPRLPRELRGHEFVDYRGAVDGKELIGRLQECELAYTPMSFRERNAVLSRTSMPGKVFAYMQAQVPILAHGPAWSSPVRFVGERGIGFTCSELSVPRLAAVLLEAERDAVRREAASVRCGELYQCEFSPERACRRLADILFQLG